MSESPLPTTDERARHAGHPTILNYSLCAITHEAENPVRLAKPGETVNCPDCRVVINFCRVFKGYRL